MPWRAVAWFDILAYACGFLAIRCSLALHEFAHVAAARLLGADVYGVYFPPVPYSFIAPETGVTLARIHSTDLLTNYVIVMSGLAAQLLAAALALIAAQRIRAGSVTQVFLVMLGGINVLDACLYATSGFYSDRGDFAGVMAATEPFGKYAFSLMFVTCAVAAYFVARRYLALQDYWLGGGTFRTRMGLALLTAGPGFAVLLTSQLLKARWLGAGIVVLYMIGGVMAVRKTRCSASPINAFPKGRLAVLLAACVAAEGFLIAQDGLIRMPDRVYGAAAREEYDDRLVAPLPKGEFSMGVGEEGTLYYADAIDGTLIALAPGTGQRTVLRAGLLRPQHVSVRHGAVYFLELGDLERLSRIIRYDLATQEQRVLVDGLYWPDCLYVAANGDVYFNEARGFLFVLRNGETAHKLLLQDFPNAGALAVDADENVYVASVPDLRKSNRSILAVRSAGGWEKRMRLTGTLYPKGMDFDSAGNLYLAGDGFSSITRIGDRGKGKPESLRGSYRVVALAVTRDGDVYYIKQEEPGCAIRVLHRKTPS